jgi:hypothetical protein
MQAAKITPAEVREERARERMRLWFEQHDHAFAISKRSHHSKAWVLVVGMVCAGALLGNHMPVTETLANIHSVLGV